MSTDSLKYGSSVHSSNGLFGDTVRTTAPPATGRVIKTSTQISTYATHASTAFRPEDLVPCPGKRLRCVTLVLSLRNHDTHISPHFTESLATRNCNPTQNANHIHSYIHVYPKCPCKQAYPSQRNAPTHHTPIYQGLDCMCKPSRPPTRTGKFHFICVLHARAAGTDGDDE
jgi:hypothetical protein